MNPRVALLVLRRAWTAGTLAGVLALALAAVLSESGVPAPLARQGLWTLVLASAALVLSLRLAACSGRFVDRERDWVAAAPLPRTGWFLSIAAGALLAALLGVATGGLAAEASARADAPGPRRIGLAPAPARGVLDGREPVRWSVEANAGERLRVELVYVALGTFAEVELRATRPDGSASVARARATAPCALDVEAPPGRGPVTLELARTAGEGLALLTGARVQRLVECPSQRVASLLVAVHATLALLALGLLALALGSWMQSGIAAALAGSLALASWVVGEEFASRWTPWGQLLEALDLAGRGVVPPSPTAPSLLFTFAVLLLAFGILVAGMRRRRSRA